MWRSPLRVFGMATGHPVLTADGTPALMSDGSPAVDSGTNCECCEETPVLCGDCDMDLEATFADVAYLWNGCSPCVIVANPQHWELEGDATFAGLFTLTQVFPGGCHWEYDEPYDATISRVWRDVPCSAGDPLDWPITDPDDPDYVPESVETDRLFIQLKTRTGFPSIMDMIAWLYTSDPVVESPVMGVIFTASFPAADFDCNGFTVPNEEEAGPPVDCVGDNPELPEDPNAEFPITEDGTVDLIGVP